MTPKQAQCLAYVVRFQKEFGFSPSYEEIGIAIDNRSKGNVHRILTSLKTRGYIEWEKHCSRSIQVINADVMAFVKKLNISEAA